jgi:hypothetical protein
LLNSLQIFKEKAALAFEYIVPAWTVSFFMLLVSTHLHFRKKDISWRLGGFSYTFEYLTISGDFSGPAAK